MNAGGDIDIKAASLTNNGRIAGNKNVNITVAGMGTINNDNGDITSYNNDINLSTLGALSNNRGSIIAQQNVNTLSDSFVNDNGIVQSTKGDMNIHSMNIIYNRIISPIQMIQ